MGVGNEKSTGCNETEPIMKTLRISFELAILNAQIAFWSLTFGALCVVSGECRRIAEECRQAHDVIDPLRPLLLRRKNCRAELARC